MLAALAAGERNPTMLAQRARHHAQEDHRPGGVHRARGYKVILEPAA
jgi:hypothetical protein